MKKKFVSKCTFCGTPRFFAKTRQAQPAPCPHGKRYLKFVSGVISATFAFSEERKRVIFQIFRPKLICRSRKVFCYAVFSSVYRSKSHRLLLMKCYFFHNNCACHCYSGQNAADVRSKNLRYNRLSAGIYGQKPKLWSSSLLKMYGLQKSNVIIYFSFRVRLWCSWRQRFFTQ